MGELVAFKPRELAPRDRESRPDPGSASAEILFFTGVRVGRFEDYSEPPKSKRAAPRRRAARRAERRER